MKAKIRQSIEVEGVDLEDAIKRALKELRASRNQVRVHVLSEEKKGLFGMSGAKPAKIRVSLKDKIKA